LLANCRKQFTYSWKVYLKFAPERSLEPRVSKDPRQLPPRAQRGICSILESLDAESSQPTTDHWLLTTKSDDWQLATKSRYYSVIRTRGYTRRSRAGQRRNFLIFVLQLVELVINPAVSEQFLV